MKVIIASPSKPFLPTREGLTANNSLMIVVKDSGAGVAKDKQRLIFEAFKQIDGTTSRKHGGTGLGLTISLELARLLGGEILLESKEEEGSDFALIIPLGQQEQVNRSCYIDSATDLFLQDTVNIAESAVLNDLLFISAAENLHASLHSAMPTLRELSCVSVNKRKYLADVKTLNSDIYCKLFVVDGEHLEASDWQFLEDYLTAGKAKYGVLVIIAGKTLEAKIETMGALFLDRNAILQSSEQATKLFSSVCTLANYMLNKILVVEDNPVFNEVIKALFTKNNVPLMIAKNGAQALNLLSHPSFVSLIVDLNLPDYSGVSLLSRIRNMSHYSHTHITVFTAADLDNEQLSQIHQYANQVVLKSPQAIADLCLQVKQILLKKSVADHSFISHPDKPAHLYTAGDLEGVNVLLVDDDERNLYSISQALEMEGMNVTALPSGEEALSLIKEDTSLQIMLLDIMMPGMDGYQVLEKLRASHDLPQLPVVALTAKAMQGDREYCLAAGASDYLSKPIDISVLLNVICRHLF